MKKNIIKPKFYTLDKDSVKEPTTGYIFFKHYPAKLIENKKKFTTAITKLYYSIEAENVNNQYIQIAERRERMDTESFIQYLIINYRISANGFKLKKLVNASNIVVYLVFLNPETKISLYYETILEIIDKERLAQTEDYWGLLSTGFMKTRKAYLNRCLYPTNRDIKLEMRFKKVYKALIEI